MVGGLVFGVGGLVFGGVVFGGVVFGGVVFGGVVFEDADGGDGSINVRFSWDKRDKLDGDANKFWETVNCSDVTVEVGPGVDILI